MAFAAKKIIGGKKGKVKEKEEKKKNLTVVKGKATKKDKGTKPAAKKDTASRKGRKAGIRNEVKKEYETKITKLFEDITEGIENVTEPMSDFLEKGSKKGAKESRVILKELKDNVVSLWRIIHTAKSDMNEVKIQK